MSKGLAQKRHHKKRLKNRRKRDTFAKVQPLNKYVITPTICSCWMCGNARKFSGNSKQGKTIQELRQEYKQKDNDDE
ncbi:Hypothetical protein DAL_41 [Psychrobacter phage D'Alembert]|nr:Hypothetical protein DAL_41 [Psychrobacter phage D'Alembert]